MPPMTGSRYFAEAMQAYEVTHVFLVPTILTPALAEMEDRNIVRVTAHSEKAAVYMADGYARISGRPGVCMAQTIGAANLAAGLRDPYLACTPVIAVTGGRLPESKHRGVYQEVDDFPLFEPLSKFNVQVDLPERLPDLLRQAFREATTGCPAPVHLEIGGNFGQAIEGEADLDPLFEPRFARYPAIRPRPEAGSLRRAAELLSRSRRPVIVAGGGVTLSGARAEVRQLAERLSIPVATSLNAKGTLPENHSLSIGVVGSYSRDCANRLVAEADLVFFIGSRTGGPGHQRLAHPAQGDPRPSTGHRARGTGPQLPQPLQPVGRRQGRPAGVECRPGLPSAGLRMALAGGAGGGRVAVGGRSPAVVAGGAHAPGAPLQGNSVGLARGRDPGLGYRPLGDLVGDPYRVAPPRSDLHPGRRIPGLGPAGGHRSQVRRAPAAGGLFYRRRRLLLPPVGVGDSPPLRHPSRDRGERQPFPQSGDRDIRQRLRRACSAGGWRCGSSGT